MPSLIAKSRILKNPRVTVWVCNALSALSLIFSLSLSGDDVQTHVIAGIWLGFSLIAAAFSLCSRFTIFGLLLWLASIYFSVFCFRFLLGQ